MRLLWICGLPREIQEVMCPGEDLGARLAWSWILGHLPPPDTVELHIACPITRGPWKSRIIEYKGATFHLLRCLPGRIHAGFLLDPYRYQSLYARLKPDIVHGWGTEDSHSIAAMHVAPRSHVVQVQGLINEYLPRLPKSRILKYIAWRERITLRRARHVFVESKYSGEIAQPYCGPATRLHYVDHPLRQELLSGPATSGMEERAIFIGTLDGRKGYMDAVEAFAEAAPPEWQLAVVGSGRQENIARFDKTVAARHLEGRVQRTSDAPAEEIARLLRSSSIFLLPSYLDTGPTALKEALALGLWPVCYRNSGPQEYITRFQYGSLCETGSLTGLSATLREAIVRKPWQEQGRLYSVSTQVREELCAATIWNRLAELYKRILCS